MYVVRAKMSHARKDERGFTLPELLVTIAILGILIAIAIILWLGLLEQRRVDAAARQLAADMRLANTSATNQLTDWRVVFMPDGSPVDGCSSADYCLVKLNHPFPSSSSQPLQQTQLVPRNLPDGTKILKTNFRLDGTNPANGAGACAGVILPSKCGVTESAEFDSNGQARTLYPGLGGSVWVSVTDEDLSRRVVMNAPTSRIRVE